jgi:tetratricopeptide (TPR) repeat protein
MVESPQRGTKHMRGGKLLRRYVTAMLLLLAAVGGYARADAPTAKDLYENGRKNYNLGHYEDALKDFEKAYQTKDDPAFLFNIAQCQRSLRRYEEAARTYRAYLRESNEVSPAAREQVQKLIAEMEKAAAEERSKQPPTGTQPPSSAQAQVATQPAPVEQQPELAKSPDTSSAIEVSKPRPTYKKGWFWGVVAGGVVVVTAAVVVGVVVGGHQSTGTLPGVSF